MMQIPNYSTEFERIFYSHVIDGINEEQKQEIIDFCNLFFPKNCNLKELEDLILMPLDIIHQVVMKMNKSKKDSECSKRKEKKYKNGKTKKDKKGNVCYEKNTADKIYQRYDSHIVDERKSIKMNIQLVELSGILVCPYCNRNFINVRDDRMGGQLDHFYSRSSFPFFAISLYNLIPSCTVCNHVKGTKSLHISPFEITTLHNEVRFEYFFKNETEIDLLMKAENKNREKDIETLKLKDAYNIHNVDVMNMLKKEKTYSTGYRSNLKDVLGIDDLEMDKLIFGEIVEADNLVNVPLGKLKSDIYTSIKANRKLI